MKHVIRVFLLFCVHRVLMQKRVNNSPPWINIQAEWLTGERGHGKERVWTFPCIMCVDRKAMLSPSLSDINSLSDLLWIKQTLDRTQRTAVLGLWTGFVLCRSVTLNLGRVTVHGCGCSLISFYKLSAAPGMALRYILYFSLAYLSVIHWCPIASMAMIMYTVSSVCLSDWEWSSVMWVTYFKARWLWHLFSPVIKPLILFLEHPYVELDLMCDHVWAGYAWNALFDLCELFFSIDECAGIL